MQIKRIIEGLLMATEEPLTAEKICKILQTEFPDVNLDVIKNILLALETDYQGRGIELKVVASGYRFQICQDLSSWVSKLSSERSPRYSKSFLETLTIIAFKQPVTRAEIEAIRGTAVNSYIIKTLLELEWIKIAGYKNVPGKPTLYRTTNKFLDHFNLKSLEELFVLLSPSKEIVSTVDVAEVGVSSVE